MVNSNKRANFPGKRETFNEERPQEENSTVLKDETAERSGMLKFETPWNVIF